MNERKQENTGRMDRGPRHGPGAVPSFEKPKHARKTILRLLSYLKSRKMAMLMVVIFLLISTICSLAGNYFLKPIINDFIIPGDLRGLAMALAGLGILFLLGVAATYGQSRLIVQVAQTTTNILRRDLFTKMQSLPLKFFDTHTHGDLMSRYTNDIDNVQMALEQSLVQFFSSILVFSGSIIMMIVLSPVLFLLILVVLGVMFLLTTKITGTSSKYFKAQQKNLGSVNGYVEEMVDGLRTVKVFNYERNAIEEFHKRNEEYRQAATNANFYAGVVFPVVGNLNNIAYAAVAIAGGLLSISHLLDIGTLAAFLQFSRQTGFPMMQITNQLNTVLGALAGAERVFDIMDLQSEVDDGEVILVGVKKDADGSMEPLTDGHHPTHWAWKMPKPDGGFEYIELKGDVRFNDVTFGYVEDKTVLHHVSLYAKPGQKIAFVGSTGAGKTTISSLINRFYRIHHGLITFDGIDVERIKKDYLRQSLGMVLQDTHLFTGTVMDNIRFGRLDATNEECIQAAKEVNAHSFIRRLPKGYDTLITADGANLSQGQRQLLAIARVAVADPPVMILDEATSSIDTRTERLIEKGMDALMKDRTVFVIAHRLSTVRNANAIIVLENGEIIERGDHNELLKQQGRYFQLYTGQYVLT